MYDDSRTTLSFITSNTWQCRQHFSHKRILPVNCTELRASLFSNIVGHFYGQHIYLFDNTILLIRRDAHARG